MPQAIALECDDTSQRDDARRRQLAALAPTKWKPGQSGNPKGRTPELHPDVRKLAKDFCPEAVERLKYWARSEDPRASIPACSILLERGCGKPAPADVTPATPEGWESLTITERIQRLRERRERLKLEATAPAPGNLPVATA